MIFLSDRPIGSQLSILVEGSLSPSHAVAVYRDGAVASPTVPVTVSNFGPTGPTKLSFTPPITGMYTLVLEDGSIAAHVDAVSRNCQSYLKNIEDEALGSWSWDRTTGTLQMLRQDGSVLANFAVVDTLTENSRERLP